MISHSRQLTRSRGVVVVMMTGTASSLAAGCRCEGGQPGWCGLVMTVNSLETVTPETSGTCYHSTLCGRRKANDTYYSTWVRSTVHLH